MIVLVTGPLGAGKSGYATALAVKRAQKHNAILASNIALTPPGGVDFVRLPVTAQGIDVDGLLSLRERSKLDGRRCAAGRRKRPCQRCARSESRMVVLVVDEVGIVMDNRFWAAAGVMVKWFLKHSRKLLFDVYATTHDPEEVDVSLRRMVTFTYSLRRIPSGGEEGDDRMPWLLVTRRWEGIAVGTRGKQLGWPSFRRWHREWASWFDSDELVEIPAEYRARAKRRAASLGLEVDGAPVAG